MRKTHLIFTVEDGGFTTVTSPQMPSLIAGWESPQEAAEAAEGLLEFAGLDEDAAQVEWHEQRYVVSPNGTEYLVRYSVEPVPQASREAVAAKTLGAIESGLAENDVHRQPEKATGEHLIIAVTETDRLGWVLDQLAPGENATANFLHSDASYFSIPIFSSHDPEGRGLSLENLGLTEDAPMSEVLDRVMGAEISQMVYETKQDAAIPVSKDLQHI